MKLIFSTNTINNTTAILHPHNRVLHTQNKSINNTSHFNSPSLQINTNKNLHNLLSFGMIDRLIQTKDCNCGK